MAKKKQKRTPAQMHRQVQDSLQALPYAIDQQKKEGKRFKALVLRYLTGPLLRVMNRTLSATRYRGTEGQKLKQSEQMRRHLEQRQAAIKHLNSTLQKQQRRGRPK